MTWEEHEKEFCLILKEKPIKKGLVYDTADSWQGANSIEDGYESGSEEGNIFDKCCAKYENVYYVLNLSYEEVKKISYESPN